MKTEYNKLSPLRLSLSYEQVCEEYRLRLCDQFGIDWHDTYWILDRIGGVLDIIEYYVIDMDELRYIVNIDLTKILKDCPEGWKLYNNEIELLKEVREKL